MAHLLLTALPMVMSKPLFCCLLLLSHCHLPADCFCLLLYFSCSSCCLLAYTAAMALLSLPCFVAPFTAVLLIPLLLLLAIIIAIAIAADCQLIAASF